MGLSFHGQIDPNYRQHSSCFSKGDKRTVCWKEAGCIVERIVFGKWTIGTDQFGSPVLCKPV